MKKFLKWTGITLGGLVGLLLIAGIVIYFGTDARLTKKYEIGVKPFTLYSDSSTVAAGRQLGNGVAVCTHCHGDDLGGKVVIDAPVGFVAAPNITSGEGSVVRNFKDSDWVRVLHHGVAPDGRPVVIMPAEDYQNLSIEEINALVSWVKSMPPVNRPSPPSSFTMLGRVLFAFGVLPKLPAEVIDHNAPIPPTAVPGVNPAYGRHLALTAGCIGCHGPTLSGGQIPGTPPDWPAAANISQDATTGIGTWSEADFIRALREGKRPDGRTLDTLMPWKNTRLMKDDDLRALYLYLKTIPAKPFGGR
ncbi:MAG TPA: cytochrome c [Candidatus Kapabacteria bacterium]|nr:cytochrome c [Candidatus Kapabacteria bacterium]